MKHRDEFHRGRHRDEQHRDEQQRDEQQDERERYRSALRDTYNPEPQWLRDDRERSERPFEDEHRRREREQTGREYSGRGSYAGSGREWGETERGWNERLGREREQRGAGPHDYSTGFEAPAWHGQDFSGGQGRYAPFRVGTGMGMGTGGYGRHSYGSGYGTSSGYGGPSYSESSWEDESARHWGAGERESPQRGMPNYGSRSGWDLGTHQRDVERESGRERASSWFRSFRGLGPKNYKRSDERIRDDVYERLTDSPMIDARYVLVDVNQGSVTLTGTVIERRMRYAAEDLVEGVLGVSNISNQLKVEAPPSNDTESRDRGPGTRDQ
jgi:hypothetical protein